ncbi:MAG: ABC transporter ATP-binding protein [Cellvibrionaceae bacterium]
MSSTALLNLNAITCAYAGNTVVENLSLSINKGDVCCLLGPSGCGKTTVLRAIAGFHRISHGNIVLQDSVISSEKKSTPPEKRHIGMVFQDYALFPHLSVCDNVTYGLHHLSAVEKERVCDEMLALVKLANMGNRFPHELSGGQQQRVALARALAPKPSVLLMDEPFSSLDVDLRRSLAIEVREILKSRDITAIMVTHDQEEAFAFADKIAVMNEGTIQQWASPFDLYHEPRTRFVANFVGQGAFLPGHAIDSTSVATEIGMISGNRCYDWLPDSPVEVLLRPDDVIHNENSIKTGEVVSRVFTGTSTLYTLKLPTGSHVISAFPSHHDYQVGDRVGIDIEADHLIAFAAGED